MPTKKPPDQTSVSTWLHNDLLARLDAHIAARCAGIPGARPSRQAWIIEAIRRQLDAATTSTETA